MRTQTLILLSSLITASAALVSHANATPAAQGTRPALAVEAKPIRQTANPMSRAEGREAADSALAGALVGIATEQFEGERIELMLDTVHMDAVSPRDRKVTGAGLLKVGSDLEWLPFRYRALYDTETQTAGWASITLGSHDAGAEAVALDDAALQTLSVATGEKMRREFPQQTVALDISTAKKLSSGRYQRYLAQGAARFDAQEPTQVQVEGLYDPVRNRWLRVSYELGDTAHWAFTDGTSASVMLEP